MRDARGIDETSRNQDELLALGAFALGREYQAKTELLRQEFDVRLRELVSGFRTKPDRIDAGQTGIWMATGTTQRESLASIDGGTWYSPAALPCMLEARDKATSIGASPYQQVPAPPPWHRHREAFLRDKPGLTTKTIWSYNQAFDQWREVIGDKPIEAIRRSDVKAFADFLRDKPNPRGGTLNHKTILRSLGHVKSFMAWAVASGLASDDRFDAVSARSMTKAERLVGPPRRAFTPIELEKLFCGSLFIGYRADSDDPAARWFFALALLTGARTDELANAPATLVRLGEIDCLDLRQVGRKTNAAPRLIPILPDLVKMGLPDWAGAQAARGYTLLQDGPTQANAASWSKRLNRYLNQNISVDPRLVLYSLRHSFRQMLRAANIGDELADKVFGHSTGKVGAGYGRELCPQEAELFVKSVRLPVDLRHLWRSS